MPLVPISWYLILSAILFALGVAGFLFRRNIITVFMSIELMLNAVNLSFVAFSYQWQQVDGHIFAFFVMVVAAAEAAVGLAIILTVFKNRATLNVDDVNSMKTMNGRPRISGSSRSSRSSGFLINGSSAAGMPKALVNDRRDRAALRAAPFAAGC